MSRRSTAFNSQSQESCTCCLKCSRNCFINTEQLVENSFLKTRAFTRVQDVLSLADTSHDQIFPVENFSYQKRRVTFHFIVLKILHTKYHILTALKLCYSQAVESVFQRHSIVTEELVFFEPRKLYITIETL
jgi:hypothetical protein